MCYTVLLSTTSGADLSAESTEGVHFDRAAAEHELAPLLKHPHRWYVGSSSGCSCTFRHTCSPELGFGVPEEWCPEEPAELQATAVFIAVVRKLLDSGCQVDCIDAWTGASPGDLRALEVDLSAIRDDEFRFFENHHFVFR